MPQQVADAMRTVAAKLQREIDDGQRKFHIDAEDLLETILAIADELERKPNHQPTENER